jgi:hypothetical protein
LSALVCWLLLQVRLNIIDLIFIFQVSVWATRFVDNVATLLLGLVALGVITGLEAYLRNGVGRGELWFRIRRATVILCSALAVSYALHYVLPRLG